MTQNSLPPLIALTGPMGCGKTTIANSYVNTPGDFVAERRRFAGPLKNMLLALGLTHAQVDGAEKDEPCALLCGKTPRYAMQTLGTDWGRKHVSPRLWLSATMLDVAATRARGYAVVIDDCRFDNEALAVRAAGGIVVQVERPGVASPKKSRLRRLFAHASEAGVSDELVDLVLLNNAEPNVIARELLLRTQLVRELRGAR